MTKVARRGSLISRDKGGYVSLPLELAVADQTLLGVPLWHSWTSLYALEKILARYLEITKIVEIGTGGGGLTLFLGLHGEISDRLVLSIDRCNMITPRTRDALSSLPVSRLFGSYDDPEILRIVKAFLNEPALVYCDNGNKVDEFHTYAELLKPGDVIMAHDYPTEIDLPHVESAVSRLGLVPFEQEFLNYLHCAILAFQKA